MNQTVKQSKPHHKKKTHRKLSIFFLFHTILWTLIFVFLLTLIITASFSVYYKDRIYPNISVGDVKVGGKFKEEALQMLRSNFSKAINQNFIFTFDNRKWTIQAKDLDIKINYVETVNNAYKQGRNPTFFMNIKTLAGSYKDTIFIPLEISMNEDLFNNLIEKIAEDIDIPVIKPSLVFEKNEVLLVSGKNGRKLKNNLIKDKVLDAIYGQDHNPIVLPVEDILTNVSEDEEKKAFERAIQIVNKKLNFTIIENIYPLEKEALVSLISFNNGFDKDKIASLTANLAQAYNTPSQNASFKFESGRVTAFKPGKDGQEINQEESTQLIELTLHQLEATTSSDLKVELLVVETPPEISTGQVNDLGIRELLGKGVSYFKGSIASRVHNIVLASSKLNGLLIKPGETFSFNDAVGDISAATGYQQAYVIQNGRTVLGDGGGVCQVSTTLFRAALNSGLPIIERYAHSYRVAYYEQGFGAGLDATVFSPSVDLKIKNDTPAHILIQTIANTNNYSLTFELYGTSDGRTAYVSQPRVWDQVPPPPPKYEDDPTLQVGQEKQVDWAAWGAKAAFDYKVTRGKETLIEKTFYSNFRPWQAVYLRGTKT